MWKYDILVGGNIGELILAVNQALGDGWAFKGDPFQYNGSICQAVYKHE